MWKKVLLAQICVCLFLVTGYISIGELNRELLHDKRSQVVAAISKHNSVADLFEEGKQVVSTVIKMPSSVSEQIKKGKDAQQYAEPLDPVLEGDITSVYAVAGGQVTETGENEEIGKYVIIQHDEAVSVYGNCCKVYAKENEHIRRGQVIGSYIQDAENEFYYKLIEE